MSLSSSGTGSSRAERTPGEVAVSRRDRGDRTVVRQHLAIENYRSAGDSPVPESNKLKHYKKPSRCPKCLNTGLSIVGLNVWKCSRCEALLWVSARGLDVSGGRG